MFVPCAAGATGIITAEAPGAGPSSFGSVFAGRFPLSLLQSPKPVRSRKEVFACRRRLRWKGARGRAAGFFSPRAEHFQRVVRTFSQG